MRPKIESPHMSMQPVPMPPTGDLDRSKPTRFRPCVESLALGQRITLDGQEVSSEFSPDAAHLAILYDRDGLSTLSIWSLETTLKLIQKLRQPSPSASDISWSPDGRRLVTYRDQAVVAFLAKVRVLYNYIVVAYRDLLILKLVQNSDGTWQCGNMELKSQFLCWMSLRHEIVTVSTVRHGKDRSHELRIVVR